MDSIRNQIQELIAEAEAEESSSDSDEHCPSPTDCAEHFAEEVDTASDLEDELVNCVDKVFDGNSQRDVTKSFAPIVAIELSLVSLTVSRGSNFSSATKNLHPLPYPKVAIAVSSSDVELVYKLFDTMSDREHFAKSYDPNTSIASLPHDFGSRNCSWVDTGQVGGSLYLDVWVFHEFKIAIKCEDASSCKICIYEGDYTLVVANSCVADILEPKAEYAENYSRNYACKVFPEISKIEIAMEIEDSANSDSFQTISQMFDKIFQPSFVVKCGSAVREDKENNYKNHSTRLRSPSKLFEIEFHVPIIDFPFDPGSTARLVLNSVTLVLDNGFPLNHPCIVLGVMSTIEIRENPIMSIAGQSFDAKKQRYCFLACCHG